MIFGEGCESISFTLLSVLSKNEKHAINAGGWTAPLDFIVGAVLERQPQGPVFEVPADHPTSSTFFLHACTELATTNAHIRDSALRFESADHKYFYKEQLVGCSVTCLAFMCFYCIRFLCVLLSAQGNDAYTRVLYTFRFHVCFIDYEKRQQLAESRVCFC